MSGGSNDDEGPAGRSSAKRPAHRAPPPAAATTAPAAAFEEGGRLTLQLPVVPLRLPEESRPTSEVRERSPVSERVRARDRRVPDGAAATAPPEEGGALDAWSTERLARRAPTPPPRQAVRPTRQLRVVRPPAEPPPLGHGHALDLVDRSRGSSPNIDLSSEMNERFALGDFTGALFVAEFLLGRDPDNAATKACAAASRARLEQLYSSRIGSLSRVAVVAVRENDMRWLGLDHRAGFLLSRVDGRASLEELLDVSGTSRLEALKTLVELYEAGAIRFAD